MSVVTSLESAVSAAQHSRWFDEAMSRWSCHGTITAKVLKFSICNPTADVAHKWTNYYDKQLTYLIDEHESEVVVW